MIRTKKKRSEAIGRAVVMMVITMTLAASGLIAPLSVFVAEAQKNIQLEGWGHPEVNRTSFLPDGKYRGLKLRKSKPEVSFLSSGINHPQNNLAPYSSTSKMPTPLSTAQAQSNAQSNSLGPNLIQNPSVETAGSNGSPASWLKGGYGANTRSLTYPVAGYNSAKAIQVKITSYTSGDAKWYFADVPVTSGHAYQFSDAYTATAESYIDIRYTMNDGSFTYSGVDGVSPTATFQTITYAFTVPANVKSLTIFHDIASVGTLTTDAYSLNDMSGGGNPMNLVANGDFETAGSNGLPADWAKGGSGTNTRTLTYPVAGASGNGAQVSITSYTSGDAKWYFNPIALEPGVYSYSDSYTSNIPSTLTVQYHNSDGSYTFSDIASLGASSSFTTAQGSFSVPSGVIDVTVFHLIEAVGTLTIDNATLTQTSALKGVFTTGGVSLSFDNGWLSQYQNAVPKLQSAGFKGTFYIITHELSDYGYSGFVSKAQIQDMYSKGEEIGAHTQTHPDLAGMSYSQQYQEVNGSRQDLLALSVGSVPSFAYPFGDYDSTTLQVVKDAGFSNARDTINQDVTPTTDPYQLPAFSVQVTFPVSQVEQWIDTAMANKQWLIITFHQIDTGGDQYSMTPTNFNTVIDYLTTKHVPVVTVTQGTQSLQ